MKKKKKGNHIWKKEKRYLSKMIKNIYLIIQGDKFRNDVNIFSGSHILGYLSSNKK